MDAGKYKQQQRPRVRPTHVQSRVISPVIAVLKWQNFATNGKIAEYSHLPNSQFSRVYTSQKLIRAACRHTVGHFKIELSSV